MRTQTYKINLGPQHPSTHGVLHVVLEIDGETIVGSETNIGYLHRGIEKLAENKKYPQVIPYTDRLDYLAGMSNNLLYVQTIEKIRLLSKRY
jgi:NADH-quinone oxidoreductase subunit D